MKSFIVLILLFSAALTLQSASYKSISTGNWSNSGNWLNGNDAPIPLGSNDVVTIQTGDSICLNSLFEVTNKCTLNVEPGAALLFNAGILTKNKLTINVALGGNFYVNGDIDAKNSAYLDINGTAIIDGNITATTNGAITGNGTLFVSGTVSPPGIVSSSLHYNPSSLPIELAYFGVEDVNGELLCKWKTLSERNNELFVVQHSMDAFLWSDIAEINGAGNSTSSIDYEIKARINQSSGIAYFRLKQVDFSGEVSFSDIVMTWIDDEAAEIGSYPNPTTGPIIFQAHNSLIQQINVLDANSRLVDQLKNIRNEKVEYTFSDDKEGVYYIEIVTDKHSDTQPVIVK